MYKHILIATDGSELAQKGVDHGLSLAANLGAEVIVVTVTEPFPIYAGEGWALGPNDFERYHADQTRYAQELLDPIKASAEKTGRALRNSPRSPKPPGGSNPRGGG